MPRSSPWMDGSVVELLPQERDTAAGAVDDARPDRWGERVIRFIDKPPRLSLLEYLYFAGDDRFGALGVSTSASQYLPRRLGPLPTLADTEAISELVRKVLNSETVDPALARLISPGVTLGGARPKALLEIDGEPWVVKFADGEPVDSPLVEHATMTLAAEANIRVAATRPIRLTHGHALAIRRFDREHSQRRHALSASVALKAAGQAFGYPELAQLLRRRGTVENDRNAVEMRELFRRMAFNILIDNTDDHEKNHALLVTDRATYELSPAYDVLPSGQGLGYQQMRVGVDEADSTLKNALSMAAQFGLKPAAATNELKVVAAVAARWREHFASAGVTAVSTSTAHSCATSATRMRSKRAGGGAKENRTGKSEGLTTGSGQGPGHTEGGRVRDFASDGPWEGEQVGMPESPAKPYRSATGAKQSSA